MILLACADPLDTGNAPVFDPLAAATAPGAYAVGHVEIDVAYDDPEGLPRTLRTAVWYPASEAAGAYATYLYGTITSEVARESAPPATGPFPLVVFSHGHQAFAEVSSFLMEHLASHGFVVVAPDHTNNTTFDGSDRSTTIYLQRPFDLTAVVDAVEAGGAGDLDTGSLLPSTTGDVVAMGHSFGGYTVFASAGTAYDVEGIDAACIAGEGGSVCTDWSNDWSQRFAAGAADERLVGILPMAPGDYWLFDGGLAGLAVPALLMTGAEDPERDADGASYWAALSPPVAEVNAACGGCDHGWVDVATAGHNAFTDFSGSLDDGGTIDPATGWNIVNAYALAFAASVTGDDRYAPLLDGSTTVHELATLH